MTQDRRDQIAFFAYLGGVIAIFPHILLVIAKFSQES